MTYVTPRRAEVEHMRLACILLRALEWPPEDLRNVEWRAAWEEWLKADRQLEREGR